MKTSVFPVVEIRPYRWKNVEKDMHIFLHINRRKNYENLTYSYINLHVSSICSFLVLVDRFGRGPTSSQYVNTQVRECII